MLDTNVVVSALAFGGVPRLLLEAGAAQTVQLFTSPVLQAELREVLAREHIAQRLAAQQRNVAQALTYYEQLCITVRPTQTPRIVPNDPDDDHVVAAALAAKANLIVSGDRHLLQIQARIAVPVLRASDALALLGAGD